MQFSKIALVEIVYNKWQTAFTRQVMAPTAQMDNKR